jgi:hypothetical protein
MDRQLGRQAEPLTSQRIYPPVSPGPDGERQVAPAERGSVGAEQFPGIPVQPVPEADRRLPPAEGESETAVAQPSPSDRGAAGRSPDEQSAPRPPAPVIVIPGDGKLTIASRDPEAIEQLEALLRVFLRRDTMGSSGNFTVYSLRNAGAVQVANLLSDLVRRLPEQSRGSLGRVSVVADERLNALIVFGGRADQKVIENLLRILDSSYLPETMNTLRPKIIPVQHAEASRILDVLQAIYRTQLTAGGVRNRLDVPQGLPPQLATLLRTISAASSGPILTLEIDEITNSIIVFAPPQLGQEVAELIQQLDENAKENASRRINIIALERMNSSRLQEALQRLSREVD